MNWQKMSKRLQKASIEELLTIQTMVHTRLKGVSTPADEVKKEVNIMATNKVAKKVAKKAARKAVVVKKVTAKKTPVKLKKAVVAPEAQ